MAAPGGGYQNQGGMPQHQMMYGSQNQHMQAQGQVRGNYPPQSMMISHMGMQPSFGGPGMQPQMIHPSSHQPQYGMVGATHNQMLMHQQHMQSMGGSMPGMPMNQDYQISQPGPHQSSTMSGGMGSQGSHAMGASGYAMSGNNYSNMNQGMQGMGQQMPMSQSMQQPPMQQPPMQQQPMQQQPMQQQPMQTMQHQIHQPQSQQQLQQPGSQQMSHLQQPLSNQGMLQPMSNQNIQQPLSQQAAQQSQSKSPMVPVMTQQHTPQSIQQMTPQMIQPQSIPGASCGPLSVGPSTQAPMSQGPPLSVNPATPGPQSHEPPKLLTLVSGVQTQKQNYIHSKALDESSKNKQPVVQDCVLAAKRLIQYDLRATYFEWSRKIGDSIRSGNENFGDVRRARDDVLAVCDLIESNMTTVMEAHKQMTRFDKVFEKEKVLSNGIGEGLTQYNTFTVISNYNSSTQQSMDNFHRTINNVSSLLKQMRKRKRKSIGHLKFMGRKGRLSVVERAKVEAFHASGLSNREIATKFGRSHNLINNFLKNPTSYGKTTPTGRKEQVTKRGKQAIIEAATNSTKGSRRIRHELGLNVSRMTAYRVIKSSPHLKRVKMMSAPTLKPNHIATRAKFANDHPTWTDEWKETPDMSHWLNDGRPMDSDIAANARGSTKLTPLDH
ncbi:unnamed protein product, partial [Mesorhabditis belari]|uniref:Tc3 transposase DNA binding domain-containing protein n=1 Tax=Mesorhabditis belari TaxID=2138241 RepID=A0AAF3E8H0_9BILA